MTLNWQGNTRITIGGTTKTPQGNPPALHLFQSNLYILYIGENGHSLYYSWLSPGNLAGEWQGNIKISTENGAPKSTTAPALCVVSGLLHMVYSGESGESLWWSWFDGTKWYGNIELFNPMRWPKPVPLAECALSVELEGDTLHLVYVDGGDLYYSYCNVGNPANASLWQATDWTSPALVIAALNQVDSGDRLNFSTPSLVALSSKFSGAASFALAARCNENIYFAIGTPPSWNLSPVTSPEPGETPVVIAGPTMVARDNILYIVYLGSWGKNLWYCALDEEAELQANAQIIASSTPQGQNTPAAALFDEQLCIAYTGSGDYSNNLYFAYTDNLPPLTVPIIGSIHPL